MSQFYCGVTGWTGEMNQAEGMKVCTDEGSWNQNVLMTTPLNFLKDLLTVFQFPTRLLVPASQRGLLGVVAQVAHCSKAAGNKETSGPRWGCITPEEGVPFCHFMFTQRYPVC